MLHDPACMERLLLDLSINVTAMFRDPTFYRAFREKVVPLLRTYPFVRDLGTPAARPARRSYSLAILLQRGGPLRPHADLRDRHQRGGARARARAGVFPLDKMQEYTQQLPRGGRHARVLRATTRPRTTARASSRRCASNVVFAQHNLASDRSFNEFHVILCRNVMIYFDRALQDRVHELFYESLAPFGVLAPRAQGVAPVHARYEERYEALDAARSSTGRCADGATS